MPLSTINPNDLSSGSSSPISRRVSGKLRLTTATPELFKVFTKRVHEGKLPPSRAQQPKTRDGAATVASARLPSSRRSSWEPKLPVVTPPSDDGALSFAVLDRPVPKRSAPSSRQQAPGSTEVVAAVADTSARKVEQETGAQSKRGGRSLAERGKSKPFWQIKARGRASNSWSLCMRGMLATMCTGLSE